MRDDSYVFETGKTRRRACEGRGTSARRSGSSSENTSVKPRDGESPSCWTRWDITSGLFSVRFCRSVLLIDIDRRFK